MVHWFSNENDKNTILCSQEHPASRPSRDLRSHPSLNLFFRLQEYSRKIFVPFSMASLSVHGWSAACLFSEHDADIFSFRLLRAKNNLFCDTDIAVAVALAVTL